MNSPTAETFIKQNGSSKLALGQLTLGAVLISLAPIFVKSSDLPPTVIGAYRCLLAFFILVPLSFWSFFKTKNFPRGTDRRSGRINTNEKNHTNKENTHYFAGRLWLLLSTAGLFFALDLYIWHKAILTIGAGLATILANTQVYYLTILGFIFLKEKITAKFLFSTIMASLGVMSLVLFKDDSSSSLLSETTLTTLTANFSYDFRPYQYALGIAMGLFAGLCYAFYTFFLRLISLQSPSVPAHYKLMIVSLITGLLLLLISLREGTFLIPYGIELLKLIALAFFCQVLGWYFIAKSLPTLSSSLSGLILLIQPVLATLLGVFIFNESFNLLQTMGAVTTLFAIYLGGLKNQEEKETAPSTPA